MHHWFRSMSASVPGCPPRQGPECRRRTAAGPRQRLVRPVQQPEKVSWPSAACRHQGRRRSAPRSVPRCPAGCGSTRAAGRPDWVRRVRNCFLQRLKREVLGCPAAAQALGLWKNEPHPVPCLAAGTQLGLDAVVYFILGHEEAAQVKTGTHRAPFPSTIAVHARSRNSATSRGRDSTGAWLEAISVTTAPMRAAISRCRSGGTQASSVASR